MSDKDIKDLTFDEAILLTIENYRIWCESNQDILEEMMIEIIEEI